MLLVNPWIVDFAAYDFWIKPVGLLTIGSILIERGYDVTLLDCMDRNHPALLRFQGIPRAVTRHDGTGRFYKEIIPKPDILRTIPRRFSRYGLPYSIVRDTLQCLSPPDVILVTSCMTYWYLGVIEIISLLKDIFPGVPVVLGGIYPTLFPEHAKEMSGADVIVVGEGEKRGPQIVDEITGYHSDPTEYQTLDDLPAPSYHLYDQLVSVALMTSRGCSYHCPFCASRLLSGPHRKRHPSLLVQEIESLFRGMGVTHFAFYDDALLVDKEDHLMPMLEEVCTKEIPAHFHTPNGLHPREIDFELARLMYRVGFQTLRLSYESKDKKRQSEMGRKVLDEDLTHAVDVLFKSGFRPRNVGSYVLMGLPGQEIDEVLESMIFVLSHGIKISLASFSPIPGTPYWDDAVAQGLISSDSDPLLTNNSIFPLRSKHFDYDAFIQLGTLAGMANGIINQNGLPLNHTAFVQSLKTFSKAHHCS